MEKKQSEIKKNLLKIAATAFSAAVILVVWQIVSETFYKESGVVPSPLKVLETIAAEIEKPKFFAAVFNTLWKSFFSFALSFVPAFFFAALSHVFKPLRDFFRPFISLCRAMPTMALVLILLLVFGSKAVSAAVAFLVVFPLVYENIYAAFESVDKNILVMADTFKVKKIRQIKGIYLPAILPYVFSSVIAGFGLNIKVVISAEVFGISTTSVGGMILAAGQGFDFAASFAWLTIAVALSFFCETVLRVISRLSMPFLYPDLGRIKRFFGKIKKGFTEFRKN
ncbi:MAG: ABC transporter permease subunit [Clostridiales bacterium]|jgi:NitT/TauT family transport system permease protein|nr:ABC transporter permease subunit [Clostridiales bacterium]